MNDAANAADLHAAVGVLVVGLILIAFGTFVLYRMVRSDRHGRR